MLLLVADICCDHCCIAFLHPCSRPAPEALRTLRSALSALGTGAPAAHAVGAVPLRDQCQSCKTIVMEAAAILQARVQGHCGAGLALEVWRSWAD